MTGSPLGMPVAHLFDSEGDGAKLAGLGGVSDPDIHKIDNRWWMFFGAPQDEKINIFSARLPEGASLDSDDWEIVTESENHERASPLTPLLEAGRWDDWLHTPSYVQGPGGVERIYYTGSSGGHSVETRQFSIGMMEKRSGRWKRRAEPVVSGSTERPCVLEPVVRYHEGKWHLWCMTAHHEAGPGELPRYWISYAESADGIQWTSLRDLFSPADNYFDAVPLWPAEPVVMITASAPNQYGRADWQEQGLWIYSGNGLSGRRSDWSQVPLRILDADAGEDWYAGGVYGPTMQRGDMPADADVIYVFFTGIGAPQDRYRLSIGRLAIPVEQILGTKHGRSRPIRETGLRRFV